MLKNKSIQSGFGLVEVLISMIVLVFLSLGIYKLQVSNSWGVAESDMRTEAVQTANYLMDSLQMVGIWRLPGVAKLNYDSTISCGSNTIRTGRTMQCIARLTQIDSVITVSSNVDGGTSRNYGGSNDYVSIVTSKKMRVTVNWTISGSTHTYTVEKAVK